MAEETTYEWKPAEKRKPRANEVIKFRRVEAFPEESKELLALWNGSDYYIFDLQKGEWVTLSEYVFGYESVLVKGKEVSISAEHLGWEYSYAPKDAYRYVPFYALAEARRNRIG